MQTLILNHYPPVIKRIKEIQQIAKAEDIEFSKLNTSINEAIRNMFVLTANETGARRFERLLGVRPKAAQGIEERRAYILAALNRREMGLSELEGMLTACSEGIKLIPDYQFWELEISVGGQERNLKMLYGLLDSVIPMQAYIYFSLEICAYMEFKEPGKHLRLETAASLQARHIQAGMETEATMRTAESFDKVEIISSRAAGRWDGTAKWDGTRRWNAKIIKEEI